MKFSVPVVYTISGWLEINADSLEDARKKAAQINEDGVDFCSIEDSDAVSECLIDEIEVIGD